MTNLDIKVSKWGIRFAGRSFPARVGKSGITNSKNEGDGATPAGIHKLVGVLYYIDALKTFNQALFDTSKEEHS